MNTLDVIRACAACPEFVANWARLRGVHLPTTPIDRMIDDATGRNDDIAQQFVADVFDLVIGRLEP
jgi:hypothetical protein